MTERHFDPEAELRLFIITVADEYRAEPGEHGTYEAATALYDEYDLCS
jgi:hypothetical protein